MPGIKRHYAFYIGLDGIWEILIIAGIVLLGVVLLYRVTRNYFRQKNCEGTANM